MQDNGAGPLFNFGLQGDWGHIFWSLNDIGAYHPRIDVAGGGSIFGFTSEAEFFPAGSYTDVFINSESVCLNHGNITSVITRYVDSGGIN